MSDGSGSPGEWSSGMRVWLPDRAEAGPFYGLDRTPRNWTATWKPPHSRWYYFRCWVARYLLRVPVE